MDFKSMDIGTITNGVGGDGVRYLESFLKEYTSIFNEKVNPGCNKCLTSYLERYKNHFKAMANTSNYKLHLKYENIPLEFGSPILVNNGNITDEYAKKLLKHPNGERYFSDMPAEKAGKASVDNTIQEKEAILIDALMKAENKLVSLPVKTHHKTVETTRKAFEKAEKALSDFRVANNLIVSDEVADNYDKLKTIELEITNDDLVRVPELKEVGYEVGSKVLVDANDYEVAGEITITNILGKEENE